MVFTPRLYLVGSALLLSLLSGCAMNPCCVNLATDISVKPEVSANCVTKGHTCGEHSSTKISTMGYGSTGSYPQYTAGQQKLMAMRAAQVDAYRNLAEQVQGFRLTGGTTVSAFALQSDTVRTYVDAFIRGARVVGVTSIGEGNYQATVELELPKRFFDCVLSLGNCASSQPAWGCGSSGCTASSATYFSY
jgi:hypothetical protein